MRREPRFHVRPSERETKEAREVRVVVHGRGAGFRLGTRGQGPGAPRGYRMSPGSQTAMGGNSITRVRAAMLMSTKGMTPR